MVARTVCSTTMKLQVYVDAPDVIAMVADANMQTFFCVELMLLPQSGLSMQIEE